LSATFSTWEQVKAKAAAVDPRDPSEREAGRTAAVERRESYVRGHQLAEMRKAAGLTQAQVAETLGVTQARVSKIEHGEISGIEIVRASWMPSAAPSTSSPPSATEAGKSPDGSDLVRTRGQAGQVAEPGQLRSSFTTGAFVIGDGAAPPPGHCTETAIDEELLE
jgi:DNA-binding XRE family transcriptional regulator